MFRDVSGRLLVVVAGKALLRMNALMLESAAPARLADDVDAATGLSPRLPDSAVHSLPTTTTVLPITVPDGAGVITMRPRLIGKKFRKIVFQGPQKFKLPAVFIQIQPFLEPKEPEILLRSQNIAEIS